MLALLVVRAGHLPIAYLPSVELDRANAYPQLIRQALVAVTRAYVLTEEAISATVTQVLCRLINSIVSHGLSPRSEIGQDDSRSHAAVGEGYCDILL